MQKRLFTPEIKRMLKDWLVRRRENPYPSRDEKKCLAINTGLTYIQVILPSYNNKFEIISKLKNIDLQLVCQLATQTKERRPWTGQKDVGLFDQKLQHQHYRKRGAIQHMLGRQYLGWRRAIPIRCLQLKSESNNCIRRSSALDVAAMEWINALRCGVFPYNKRIFCA